LIQKQNIVFPIQNRVLKARLIAVEPLYLIVQFPFVFGVSKNYKIATKNWLKAKTKRCSVFSKLNHCKYIIFVT